MGRSLWAMMIVLTLFTTSVNSQKNITQGQSDIDWYRAEFPPVTIPAGPDTDKGFFDKAMHELTESLPQYQHISHIANFKRIVMEMKNGHNICCPSLYKNPDRETFISFSDAAMVVLPNGLISTKENLNKLAPHINNEGYLSLRSLLGDDNITLGISQGRRYSGGLDKILNEHSNTRKIVRRAGADVFLGLLSMMFANRVDCIIGYPVEAGYFASHDERYKDYIFLPIKENTATFTVGYIGCTKNAWGENIIQQINDVVRHHRDEKFINFYGDWLDPQTRKTHRIIAKEYYRSIADN